MDYIKSFFSNNENNDNNNKGFEIPKYDPSKDKPSNLNDRKHLLDDLSNDEPNQFKKKLPESSYSPYSLPPETGRDSAENIEYRRKIGQASLENCSILESLLNDCINNGSFTDKNVRGCDWLREQFYACLSDQRHTLSELGYAQPGNSEDLDFKIQMKADKLAQEREREAQDGKHPFDNRQQ